MSTLNIVASDHEFVPICRATLREICWDGGIVFVGADPSDSSGQIGAKKSNKLLGKTNLRKKERAVVEESPQFHFALVIGEKQKLKGLKRIAPICLIMEVNNFSPRN